MEEPGAVPNGWVMTTVGRIGAVRLGRQRAPDRHTGQFATKYLRAGNISASGLDLNDVMEMDFSPSEREVFRLCPATSYLQKRPAAPTRWDGPQSGRTRYQIAVSKTQSSGAPTRSAA